jgi:spore germination protein GerM
MTRDPFDRMASNNPVQPDQAPPPPMATAERIMGTGTAQVPGWFVAVAAAALAIVVGGGTLMLTQGGDNAIVADASSTTTAAATTEAPSPSSTVAAATTTVSDDTAPISAGFVVVYLLAEDPTATGVSPALIPTVRPLAALSVSPVDKPAAAVGFLLAGPTPGESQAVPALSSEIPEGTTLLGIDVTNGIATVDLSGEFGAGSGSFSEIARLEQLVYTLTRFEDIDGIRLLLDGIPVEVFGGHGIVLDDPVVRTEFDTTLPAILIDSPPFTLEPEGFGTDGYPLVASGTANVFEATVSVTLTDADGLILWEGFTTASCGTGCRGDWSISIPYAVDVAQRGSLIVWEESARDGSQVNVREHPVWLIPTEDEMASSGDLDPVAACSGSLVTDPLIDQAGLPPETAQMRAAIFTAATLCDWDLLRSLQVEGFGYSFGVDEDAIAYWQELEASGEEPIRYLAELLNRPFGVQPAGDVDYYSWPAAFVTEWGEVSDANREALRPLYDDDDFAGFADFGAYIGYRVGIVDGTWVFFLRGD